MKNIIITGGELFNKGAQAMTFVTVYELKKRFPDHEIYLLSEMDRQRPSAEKEQYAFSFTGWYPIKFARCRHDPVRRMAYMLRSGKELRECETLYNNCDLMVDISGYGLGSNWDNNQLNTYIDHLEYAKAFQIPVYLMPQSFGPFGFSEDKKNIAERLPELLKYTKLICAREKEGYDALIETYHLDNVCLAPDLVLNNKAIDLETIYKKMPACHLPLIEDHSVGVIPNVRTLEIADKESMLSLYRSIITWLLGQGKHVCLLTHATADMGFCREIAGMFAKEEKVALFDRDFSCVEYNELVKEFEYVVASRYHSVIHAYKNRTPCLVLGWSTKYNDLLNTFDQSDYCVDLRRPVDADDVIAAISGLDQNWTKEADKLSETLKSVQEENVFDVIDI